MDSVRTTVSKRKKKRWKAGEMTQQIKMPATKPHSWSMVPGIHMVEEENHTCKLSSNIHPYMYTKQMNKMYKTL